MKLNFSNKRIARLAVGSGTLSLAALLSATVAHAQGSYLNTWAGIYPSSTADDNADCQLCHASSTQQLNAYGAAICSSGAGSIGNGIQAVESANSDADPTNASNITEINADTQPGWTPGNVNPTFSRNNCNSTGLVEAPPGFITGDLDPAPGNQSPVADANGPYSGTVNVPLTLDGTGSNDPDGTIVSYNWDFGDTNTGTGASPTHTYLAEWYFHADIDGDG